MAKKRINYATGKTTSQLMGMDYENFMMLDKNDLKSVVQRLASTANKRMDSFLKFEKKEGYANYSPLMGRYKDNRFATTNKININGDNYYRPKTLNQLRAEYKRVTQFLRSEGSTQAGYNKIQDKTIKSLSELGINVTREEFSRMFEAYERLGELKPEVKLAHMKYKVLAEIKAYRVNKKGYTGTEIATELESRIEDIYKKMQRERNKKNEHFIALKRVDTRPTDIPL